MIHISLSPNLQEREVGLAARQIIGGARGGEADRVAKWFADRFGGTAATFNSGRSALWAVLKALGVGEGDDEVIVQAFTCVAVPNSVKWAGARPVYADVKKGTYSMDPDSFKKKIGRKTRAVVVQHTFGMPAEVEEIVEVAKKRGVTVIEDCAHVLGGKYRGMVLGSFGDGAVFSLGRDKAVSSVFGGVGVVRDSEVGKRMKETWAGLPEPDGGWVRQQLMHPLLTRAAMDTYGWGLGKLILAAGQKMGLLSLAVCEQERRGVRPRNFPSKYPDELAAIGLSQLDAVESFNRRRVEAAAVYAQVLGEKLVDGAVYLRYPVLVGDPAAILAKARKKRWIWGDWYRFPVTPDVDGGVSGYEAGSCPVAEEVCGRIINLPTHPRMNLGEAEEIAEALKIWLK